MSLHRVAAFLLFCGLAAAQQQPQEVIIRTHAYTPSSAILHAGASLVETRLIVRDGRGRGVAGLHAGDFEVLDNGAPRPIVSFSEIRSAVVPNRAADAAVKDADTPSGVAAPKYV